jgi:hypothetical protein
MSKKNILSKERLPNGKVQVIFENEDGNRTYEYSGAAARAVMLNRDPGTMKGKLISREGKK